MADSILSTKRRCFICRKGVWLEMHHVFGAANREKSEKYGLKVYLCHWCHNEPPNGVHHNSNTRMFLQKEAQRKAMQHYGWTEDDFRKIFGKNYL